MVIAGDWWNPVTWLQSVGGFFHGAYDAGGAVLNVLGGALTILTQFFRFFLDTGPFIADAVNWVTQTLFPPELQTWFLGTIGQPGQQWNSAQIYESLYRGMMPVALMIAGVAAAGRIIRALTDHRTGSMDTILSVLPRFLLAVAVIGIPGTAGERRVHRDGLGSRRFHRSVGRDRRAHPARVTAQWLPAGSRDGSPTSTVCSRPPVTTWWRLSWVGSLS